MFPEDLQRRLTPLLGPIPSQRNLGSLIALLSCPRERIQNTEIALCTKMFTIVLLMPVKTPSVEIIALPMLYPGAAILVLRILHSAQ